MEIGRLPKFLQDSIKQYNEGSDRIKRGEKYYYFDWDFENLQSDINVAEVEQIITAETANELRRKYLYASEEQNT